MALENAKGRPNLDKGDAALLRFAAAAKFSKPISGFSTTNSPEFRTVRNQVALEISLTTTLWRQLDEDMDQYIHDNTEDERTHFTFLNAYLVSKARSRWIWNSFVPCRAAPRPVPVERYG